MNTYLSSITDTLQNKRVWVLHAEALRGKGSASKLGLEAPVQHPFLRCQICARWSCPQGIARSTVVLRLKRVIDEKPEHSGTPAMKIAATSWDCETNSAFNPLRLETSICMLHPVYMVTGRHQFISVLRSTDLEKLTNAAGFHVTLP